MDLFEIEVIVVISLSNFNDVEGRSDIILGLADSYRNMTTLVSYALFDHFEIDEIVKIVNIAQSNFDNVDD